MKSIHFTFFSRLMILGMWAILCFALLVPLALRHHHLGLAILIAVAFIGYTIANVAIWRKMGRPG